MLSFVEGLPHEGMFNAMRRAKSTEDYHRFLGWDTNAAIGADIFDAIYANTRMTGMWEKNKVPDFPPYPNRPAPPKEKKKLTVRDLFNKFQKAGAPVHGNNNR